MPAASTRCAPRRDRVVAAEKAEEVKYVIAFVLLLGASSPCRADYDNKTPLWKQVSNLICQAQHYYVCMRDRCAAKESTAFWDVDFKRDRIQYLNTKFIEKIVAKKFRFFDFGSSNTVFLESRSFSFFVVHDGKFPGTKERIVAATTGADHLGGDIETTTIYFDCFEKR